MILAFRVEVTDVAQQPTVHRTSSHNKNYQASNVSRAMVKKPEVGIKWTLREKVEKGRVENVVFVSPLPTQVKRKEHKSSLQDQDKSK